MVAQFAILFLDLFLTIVIFEYSHFLKNVFASFWKSSLSSKAFSCIIFYICIDLVLCHFKIYNPFIFSY